MTSSHLFFKLLREDAKRRLWSIVLLLLVYFFVFPVNGALSVDFQNGNGLQSLYDYCEHWGASSETLFFIAVIAAVVLAVSGFRYLHSRKALDFYHSQPVSRGMWFAVVYVDGILIFAGTLFTGILSALLVLVVSGAGYAIVIFAANMFYGYFIFLLDFLAFYSLAVIAVEFAGKTLLSVVTAGVLYGYPAVVAWLLLAMKAEFFDTYSAMSEKAGLVAARFVSPVLQIWYNHEMIWWDDRNNVFELTVQELQKYGPVREGDRTSRYQAMLQAVKNGVGKLEVKPVSAVDVILLVAMIAACVIIAYLLYKRRPSEGAGNALAFEKAKPAAKFLVAVPGAIGCGLFFNEVGESGGWLVFGLLCGAVVLCCGLEAVFQSDIRAGMQRKKELLITIGGVFLICASFRFDWFGYDRYLPEKEKILSVSVDFGFDSWAGEYDTEFEKDWNYRITGAKYDNIDRVYPLLKYAASPEASFRNAEFSEDSCWYSFLVTYYKTDGRIVYRRYMVDMANPEVLELIAAIYDDQAYRDMFYVMYYNGFDGQIGGMEVDAVRDVAKSQVDRQQTLEFLEIYRRELSGIGVGQLLWEEPVYAVRFISQDEYPDEMACYPVYADCKESVAWLEQYFNMDQKEEKEILWICVEDRNGEKERWFNRWDDKEIIECLEKQIHYSRISFFGSTNESWDYTFGIRRGEQAEYYVRGMGTSGGMADLIAKPSWDVIYDDGYYYNLEEEWSDGRYKIFYFSGSLKEGMDFGEQDSQP